MEYEYQNAGCSWDDAYLFDKLVSILEQHNAAQNKIFEVGCGNGYLAKRLTDMGYDVTGIDISESGIKNAKETYKGIKFYREDLNQNLATKYGSFPIVVSLEVIEHVFSPKQFMETFLGLIETGGIGIISTPYHGFIKNLAIVLFGKFDEHFSPLWDGGHIKFFSRKTFASLLNGFPGISYELHNVGRISPLAKSLVAIIRK